MAGRDLAQYNVAFPGTGARTFRVTHCTSGVIVAVGEISCVLDRPVVCGEKTGSGYFCPLDGNEVSGCHDCIAGFKSLVSGFLPSSVLPCSGLHHPYGPGWNPLKLNSSLGFS